MTTKRDEAKRVGMEGLWEKLKAELADHGIDVDCCDGRISVTCGGGDSDDEACCDEPRLKVVCVAPGVKDTVEEMSRTPRDQVLMVRVDEATSRDLDAWVGTGAVKSRSEAAALFIREGLKVRQTELEKLREALSDVEAAKERLKERAREVFGEA